MVKFAREKFILAKTFIFERGRPLDQALFNFHFESGSKESVIIELAKFQNQDGGFGHALEPDLRTPISSSLATSVALREMVEIGVTDKNEILRMAIKYLVETLDRKNWKWNIAPKGITNAPHAPWWGAEDLVTAFRGCVANPSAEIVGLMLNFEDIIPKDIMGNLLERMTTYITEVELSGDEFSMHDLVCYITLANSKKLDNSHKRKIIPYLKRATDIVVEKRIEKWGDYCARPLWLCTSPESFTYSVLRDDVSRNLDFEIETQNNDGSWSPFWDWGENYPDVWPTAKREWSSHLTLNNLVRLKNFGRIK